MPDAQPVARISNVRPLRAQTTALLDVTASSRASSRDRARPHRVDSRTKKLATLEAEVQSLRAEVTRLLQLRQVLREQALNRVDASMGSPCRIVKKYFDVFQRGYNPPALPSPDGFHPDTFLESIMDEAVVGGGFHGVDIMVEQWKRYSTAFVGSQINFKTAHVTCVDMADDGVTMSRVYVQATAYYFGYLTLAGVQAMFPHVITNAGLVMSLIGQLIGGDGRYLFVFDCETQRIVECRIDIDMVSAFAKVVERPQDLELLFGTALLTSQYYMGDDVPEPSEFDPLMPEPILCDESKKDADEQMNLERILS